MEVGIVGLPRSGKTTIFNVLTRGGADVGGYGASHGRANVGVAKVPEPRLDEVGRVLGSQRLVQAEAVYVDAPAPIEGAPGARAISGQFLNRLQRADALLLVARAFGDPAVTHDEGGVDCFRDVETMRFELTVADAGIVARRLQRLTESFKSAKAAEREVLEREQALLARVKAELEEAGAIRNERLAEDESRLVEGYQLLTAKPLVVVLNVGEEELDAAPSLEARIASDLAGPRVRTAALCGKLEMELAQIDPEDEAEFRKSLGLLDPGRDRMIRLTCDAQDLIAFFTGNQREARAWLVPRGTTALRAAGKVHSDLERGFIRAEAVSAGDLIECGGMAEARRRGLLRSEGRDYVVRDGDVLNILFSA